jgi:chemotaxis protein CheC
MILNPDQMDALTELVNIGVGRGASVLNTMLSSHISLVSPSLRIIAAANLAQEMRAFSEEQLAVVRLGFKGSFAGSAELMFTASEAAKLITALTNEDPPTEDIDALRAGTLCEIGNVVLNSVMGSFSNILALRFSFAVPNYAEGNYRHLWCLSDITKDSVILLARTHFRVEQFQTEGNINVFLQLPALDTLLAAIDHYVQAQAKA